MLRVTTESLLRVWETMWNRAPCEQAVALVLCSYPELSQDEVLSLPVGRRDALLLELRSALFGPRLDSLVRCPECSEPSEFSVMVDELRMDPSPLGQLQLEYDDHSYSFRLPNSADLMALKTRPETDGRRFLVDACLQSSDEEFVITDSLVDAISNEMAENDPQAHIAFDVCCAACDHPWEQDFDIVSFLWSELSGWCQRLIREVHSLASAYGWSESDILAMSATRRQIYLNMAGS